MLQVAPPSVEVLHATAEWQAAEGPEKQAVSRPYDVAPLSTSADQAA